MTDTKTYVDAYTLTCTMLSFGIGIGWLISSLVQPMPPGFGWVAFAMFIALGMLAHWGIPMLVEPSP